MVKDRKEKLEEFLAKWPFGAGTGIARGFGTGHARSRITEYFGVSFPLSFGISFAVFFFRLFPSKGWSPSEGELSSRPSPSLFPSSFLDGARARRGRRSDGARGAERGGEWAEVVNAVPR